MPELPEVETLRPGLSTILPGRRIAAVRVLDYKVVTRSPKITAGTSPAIASAGSGAAARS